MSFLSMKERLDAQQVLHINNSVNNYVSEHNHMSTKRKHKKQRKVYDKAEVKPNGTISYLNVNGPEPIAWCLRINQNPVAYGFYSMNKSLLEAFVTRMGDKWKEIYRVYEIGPDVTLDQFIDRDENRRIIIGALNRRDKKS